jgi:hypothetical protein
MKSFKPRTFAEWIDLELEFHGSVWKRRQRACPAAPHFRC